MVFATAGGDQRLSTTLSITGRRRFVVRKWLPNRQPSGNSVTNGMPVLALPVASRIVLGSTVPSIRRAKPPVDLGARRADLLHHRVFGEHGRGVTARDEPASSAQLGGYVASSVDQREEVLLPVYADCMRHLRKFSRLSPRIPTDADEESRP